MSQNNEDSLRARVKELEEEVAHREQDLATFRRELSSANKRLEALIGELNGEIKVVQAIQKHLVPTEIPNIQGFEFSTKFVPSFVRGGDYFDVFEHEDRSRFGVIIASSSGHVMSALLLSVLLKFTGRMEARRGSEPHLMLKSIADELKTNIQGNDSADIFYGLFDRRQFSLAYSKLGEVTALHYDYAVNELRSLKPSSPPLASNSQLELVSQSVALNPRDKLIFCTKGVVESQNLEGQEFGQDRLYKSVLEYATRGVHELRNQIFFKVQEFSGGQELPRDMTVVVAEVKDRVIKLAKK
jgi:phosphoserine phosphatase RsbU/P